MTLPPDLKAALSGCAVRLHMSPLSVQPVAIVAVARDAAMASPEVLTNGQAAAHCMLPLPEGCTVPDRTGLALMAEVLAVGGTALLCLHRLADALTAAEWCRAAAGGGA